MQLRLVTWNVNGLRGALKKGFDAHVAALRPDVLLLQEIRCVPEQVAGMVDEDRWEVVWHPAERPGYAGTAVWVRRAAGLRVKRVRRGMAAGRAASAADPEGRVLSVDVADVGGTGDAVTRCVSVYLPSGSSSPERQAAKDNWMEAFAPWAAAQRRARVPVVLAGDLNIAHTERDIYYAKANAKQSGFLPHERAWMGGLLKGGAGGGAGWHDAVREAAGDVDGPYSWWSNRGGARDRDRGWRIDYVLTNPAATQRIVGVETHRACALNREVDGERAPATSDHAPLSIDLR